MVADGGLVLETQSLKLDGRPSLVCIVFESIRLLCAQYLRNNSGVDSLVRKAQRAAGGAEGLGSTKSSFTAPGCDVDSQCAWYKISVRSPGLTR